MLSSILLRYVRFSSLMLTIFYATCINYHEAVWEKMYGTLSKQYIWLRPWFFDSLYSMSKLYKLDPRLVCSIINSESYDKDWRPTLKQMQYACSRSGARGFMQVMPFHHNGPATDLYGMTLNFHKGMYYLKLCLGASKGNPLEAARMYNAGINSKRHKYRNWNNYAIPVRNNYLASLQ